MGYYMAGGPMAGIGTAYEIGRALAQSPLGASPSQTGPAHRAAIERIRAAGQVEAARGGWVGRVGDMVRQPDDEFFADRAPPRMNYANPKAVRRAIRRVSSFARAAVKMMPNLRPAARRGRKANPFARKRRRK